MDRSPACVWFPRTDCTAGRCINLYSCECREGVDYAQVCTKPLACLEAHCTSNWRAEACQHSALINAAFGCFGVGLLILLIVLITLVIRKSVLKKKKRTTRNQKGASSEKAVEVEQQMGIPHSGDSEDVDIEGAIPPAYTPDAGNT